MALARSSIAVSSTSATLLGWGLALGQHSAKVVMQNVSRDSLKLDLPYSTLGACDFEVDY